MKNSDYLFFMIDAIYSKVSLEHLDQEYFDDSSLALTEILFLNSASEI